MHNNNSKSNILCIIQDEFINSLEELKVYLNFNPIPFQNFDEDIKSLNYKVILRTLPLFFIVPIGVFLGTKLFTESSKENYKKYVLYFLILVSIFGLIRVLI